MVLKMLLIMVNFGMKSKKDEIREKNEIVKKNNLLCWNRN